jgi:hypothetical protein
MKFRFESYCPYADVCHPPPISDGPSRSSIWVSSGRLWSTSEMVHMRTLMVVVLGAIVVGLPVFSPMLRAKKGPATATEATVPQLERDIPELMKKAGVPGLAIAVIRGGETTWLHGCWMKEVKRAQRLGVPCAPAPPTGSRASRQNLGECNRRRHQVGPLRSTHTSAADLYAASSSLR